MSSFYADMPEHGVGVDFGVRHSWVLMVWSLSFFLDLMSPLVQSWQLWRVRSSLLLDVFMGLFPG